MIKNIKQIDFLKIDCEGCEYEVIKYLSDDFLRTKINKIVMEFHKDLNSTETLLLLSKLEKNGYMNTVKGDIILSINKNKKIKKWNNKKIDLFKVFMAENCSRRSR